MLAYIFAAVAALPSLALVQAQYSSIPPNSSLPIVDLGYELHQALYFNETGRFYNFSNIRYGAPPLGALRFAAPQEPAVNRSAIQKGDVGKMCPQAIPGWEVQAEARVLAIVAGVPADESNVTQTTSAPASTPTSLPSLDPRMTEDCLFLDVVVPEQILGSAGTGPGAPVLVWIYGGGYVGGDKSGADPAGLLAASGSASAGEIVFVALNYRLGAFGFLSGPTFQEEGAANAGLLDQRLALEWVQKHIHLFGGDPNRVTVIGESAGGGSIMHQITAYGGKSGPAPFQQAVLQSPGWLPLTTNAQQETIYQEFLSYLNVSSLAEARALPSNAVILANILHVYQANYGNFVYGPTVDGDFAPALPGVLLSHGQFDKSVKVMVGHNADEGLLFTPPNIQSDELFRQYIAQSFSVITDTVLDYVTQVLYPSDFTGTYGYTSQLERAALALSESIFSCNTNYLDRAYNNETYSYLFSVPPALHGADIPYTFYDHGSLTFRMINSTVAIAMQEFITSFAITGTPVGQEGIPVFHMYGEDAAIMNLNITSIAETRDPAANERCSWWQKALYS